MKQSIGNFLLRRLQGVGVQHIFGVPGDYNLEFMQQLEDRGYPAWIGTCNELNGSYAADGYARMRGLGALAVTNGVGALSVMNGIAGAYSEHVPIICICGSLPLRSLERGEMMHHTLADGGRGNFYRAFSEITAAQAELSPENAVTEIDRLILTAWRRKLPVYIELPSDISYVEIDTPDEPLQLTDASSNHERVQACASAILARMSAAHSPAFLLDLDAHRFGVLGEIRRLAEKLQMPVAVLNTCKASFDETSPLFAGLYLGAASAPVTRDAVEKSDCLLTVGLRRLDSTSAFFSDSIPSSAIHLNASSVNLGLDNYQAVSLPELLEKLIEGSVPASSKLPPTTAENASAVYFPACINRIFGASKLAHRKMSLPEAFVAVSQRAGYPLFIPRDVVGNCCGTVWHSKGYNAGNILMANRVVESMWRWSKEGTLPIVSDATSCTLGLKQEVLDYLTPENRERHRHLTIYDSITWADEKLFPNLKVKQKARSATIHPTCSMNTLGVDTTLRKIAADLAEKPSIP